MSSAHPRIAVAAALLAAAALLSAACDSPSAERDLQDIEAAYNALRDAILQGDDEAFHRMHCAEARDGAIRDFPFLRAKYLSLPPDKRQEMLEEYHVGDEEFRNGEPRAMVVKIMPWTTGWRGRKELYRTARVKDVRIEMHPLPGGGQERRGIVLLDISDAVETLDGKPIPDRFLPTVVFVKDPDGWRRRYFF